MSDQQAAFDNWEDAAEEMTTEVQPEPVPEPKKQEPKLPQPTPVQAKQTIKQKVDEYKALSEEQFEEKLISSATEGLDEGEKRAINLTGGKVLKNDKDFNDFAKAVASRLCDGAAGEDQLLDEESICTMMEQLLLVLYNGLEWTNMFEIQKKLKVIKNERKNQEKKLLKEKQKKKAKEDKAEEESLASSKAIEKANENSKVVKDELFGGAATVNSKQEEDERKKKAAEKKVEVKKVEEDDDDFM